jgi:hypothetical protein
VALCGGMRASSAGPAQRRRTLRNIRAKWGTPCIALIAMALVGRCGGISFDGDLRLPYTEGGERALSPVRTRPNAPHVPQPTIPVAEVQLCATVPQRGGGIAACGYTQRAGAGPVWVDVARLRVA